MLQNKESLKVVVIVNDMSEINVDAAVVVYALSKEGRISTFAENQEQIENTFEYRDIQKPFYHCYSEMHSATFK